MTKDIGVDARTESVRLEEQASAPISPGAGFTHVFVKSDGLYIVNDPDETIGPFITGSAAGGHSTGTMSIYRDDTPLGVFDEIRFRNSIGAWNSGTYAAVDYNGIGARVSNSANLGLVNAVTTTLSFDTERYDTDGIHSAATGTSSRLTCQTAGVYIITGLVEFASNVTGYRQLYIWVNETTYIAIVSWHDVSAAGSPGRTFISCEYDLSIGDYVELRAIQNSGGSLDVVTQANRSPIFMMSRIG